MAVGPMTPFCLRVAAAIGIASVLCSACGPVRYESTPEQPAKATAADFGAVVASGDVRAVATWVLDTNDHAALPFAIIDKKQARGYVFSSDGRLIGDSPVLVGLTHGDEVEPGIGRKAIAQVRPDERRTPAGRFASVPGHTLTGDRVIWLDYDEGIAMHTIVTNVPAEERARRMASPVPADHRISYGCINFPPPFFADVVAPALARGSVVYVLPDTRSIADVFASLKTKAHDGGGAPMRAAEVRS